jgi:signal transduction histidine kinase
MKLSVRVSLMLWYCVVFCLSVGLLEVGVYFGLDKTITTMIDKELSIRMNGLDDFLQDHLGRLPLSRVLTDLQTHVALQPDLTILQNVRGHTLYCGTQVQELCSAPVPNGNRVSTGSRHLRIRTTVDTIHGVPYTLLVATNLHFHRELLERFRLMVLLIVPAALIFAAAGGHWLSKRAFAPVREIIASVRSINERKLSLRLRVPTTGDEIQLLSETLNGMLARVDTSFCQITELTANASHELRTPIAIIRAVSEVALLSPRATSELHRKALVQILAEAEKSTGLLDTLLLLARADAGVQPLNVISVSLQESMAKAIEACRHLADAKGLTLSFHVESKDTRVWADAVQLHRLWLLLIDNAIKYPPEVQSMLASNRLRIFVRSAKSATPGSVSLRPTCPTSFTASSVRKTPERKATLARVLDLRWSDGSSTHMALSSMCRANSAMGPVSASSSLHRISSWQRSSVAGLQDLISA